MIAIDFIDETDVVTEKQCALIEALIATAAKEEGLDGSYELSVTFMTDEMIQVYNRDYRGIDRPTDVISFALEDEVEGEVGCARRLAHFHRYDETTSGRVRAFRNA